MSFGTEILFLLLLALIFLGPRQMHAMLRHIARAKAEFDQASRNLRAQLDSELEAQAEPSALPSPVPELAAPAATRPQPLREHPRD